MQCTDIQCPQKVFIHTETTLNRRFVHTLTLTETLALQFI